MTPPAAAAAAALDAGPATLSPVSLDPSVVAAVARVRGHELDAVLQRYEYLCGPPPPPLHEKEGWFDPGQQRRWIAKRSTRRYRWLVPFIGAREAARSLWEPHHAAGPAAARAMIDAYRRHHALTPDERERRVALRCCWRLALLDSVRGIAAVGPIEQAVGDALYAHLSVLALGAASFDYQLMGTDLFPALAHGDIALLAAAWGRPRGHADFASAYPHMVREALHRCAHADLARTNAAKAALGVPPSTIERWIEDKALLALAERHARDAVRR